MKFGYLIKSVLASAALWASADTAMALKCDFEKKAVIGEMPLQVSTITVGRDVPVGAEVYRQTFNVASGATTTIVCNYSAPFRITSFMEVSQLGDKASWNQGAYANKVYKTDVDGLGVVFLKDGKSLPLSHGKWNTEANDCAASGTCRVHYSESSHFELVLIKIGDVKQGRLSSIPTLLLRTVIGGEQFRVLVINTTGAIQVVSRTCSTPDVLVPMGTHQTKAFTGINSDTGWKDFHIALNNCPAFHGTYNANPPSWISAGGEYQGGRGIAGSQDNNNLQFRIDPTRSAYDASKGVLSLDPSTPGSPPAASGIGIQISMRNRDSMAFGRNHNSGLSLRAREGNYTIPLRARYIQTGRQVTPGPANASAMFTIIYQ